MYVVYNCIFFFLMFRRPPISTRPDPLLPYPTLFRSHLDVGFIQAPARIKATPPEPAQPLLHLRGVALDPAIDRRMVDRNAAFRQHFLTVAIADRLATIPAHRPQDHIPLEMAPLEIRHHYVRQIAAKHETGRTERRRKGWH